MGGGESQSAEGNICCILGEWEKEELKRCGPGRRSRRRRSARDLGLGGGVERGVALEMWSRGRRRARDVGLGGGVEGGGALEMWAWEAE